MAGRRARQPDAKRLPGLGHSNFDLLPAGGAVVRNGSRARSARRIALDEIGRRADRGKFFDTCRPPPSCAVGALRDLQPRADLRASCGAGIYSRMALVSIRIARAPRAIGYSRAVVLTAAVLLAGTIPQFSLAQSPCRVLDPELPGRYEGGCVDGLASGRGRAEGSARYEGEFWAGMKHGRGVKVWPSGDRYEGEFFEDRRHGRGAYTWGRGRWAGERYEGEYRSDRRHGYGVYTWPSGDRYAGPWENDVMTGPPTPMMRLRAQAIAAARAALARPGVRVCQWVAIGIGNRTRIRGEVAEFSAAQIAVRIAEPGPQSVTAAGVPVRAGDVVWDDFLAWEPC
ncbi:MAG: hypothetical protein CO164_10950 [Rhodocyclales bacterium CG_4_9_14_3_um_filter_68_10]|nr:MAG: hypothetical protein CO164_10950 [Rhodocyclales bacterium CG_4_9_14_3_um_filter_68_10]